MKKFELNNLGKNWIFEAETEEEATKILIKEVCGAKTIQEYFKYCDEVGVTPNLEWKRIE